MEKITQKIKLIGGVLIIISCFLPFLEVSLWHHDSMTGFTLCRAGFLGILSMSLILGGAVVLICVGLTKEINFSPKFTLSFVAKLATLTGGTLMLVAVLFTSFISMGAGLILVLIITVLLLFEGKIIAIIKTLID